MSTAVGGVSTAVGTLECRVEFTAAKTGGPFLANKTGPHHAILAAIQCHYNNI